MKPTRLPTPLSFNVVLLHYTVFCLIAEPLETNFEFSSESGKRRMIMWRLSQAGSEADDTAIIWSLRCSIDSRSTHTLLCLSATDGESRLLKSNKICTHTPATQTRARPGTQTLVVVLVMTQKLSTRMCKFSFSVETL